MILLVLLCLAAPGQQVLGAQRQKAALVIPGLDISLQVRGQALGSLGSGGAET